MTGSQPLTDRQVLIPTDLTLDHLRGVNSGFEVKLLEGETMGSYWRLHYQQPHHISPVHIRRRVEISFDLIIAQMSHWSADSELTQFNNAAAGEKQRLSPEFRKVLTRALEISKLTDGAYDPTVGRLVARAGFGPHANEADLLGEGGGSWEDITFHADGAVSHSGRCHLDLSSIAKGYAIDHAAAGLKQLGVHDFLLEIGGEFRGEGCKPDGQPWWALLDPLGNQAVQGQSVVAMCGVSLATSGIVEQRVETGEGTWHHLIDPATGRPSTGQLQAVSVIASSCMEADAWATAFFVLGTERGMELAEKLSLAACFFTGTGADFQETGSSRYAQMLTDSGAEG